MEIPAPKSGLGFDLNRDVTTTELVSGGRAVYRTPLGYKAFSMSWAGGTAGLGDFMDMFEGAYGNGPFYILDPRSKGQNLLPMRWASCWQLGHMANGWCRPAVNTQSGGTITPEKREVVFTGKANALNPGVDTSPFRVLIPVEYGKQYSIKAWGTATGGAQLLATPYVDTSALTPRNVVLDGATVTTHTPAYLNNGNFIQFTLYVPTGATLTLRHIELYQGPYTDGKTWHMGRGVGAVQFDGSMQGTLTSNKIDRIGLSVGMTEVES